MTEGHNKTAAIDKLFGATPPLNEVADEDRSKDAFFLQLAEVAEAMIAKHGKDFAMGTLVLAARFIAEGKPLIKRNDGAGASLS